MSIFICPILEVNKIKVHPEWLHSKIAISLVHFIHSCTNLGRPIVRNGQTLYKHCTALPICKMAGSSEIMIEMINNRTGNVFTWICLGICRQSELRKCARNYFVNVPISQLLTVVL